MLIGLTGFIGSGKTTVANLLVKDYNYRTDSFAATVKGTLAVIFDWPRDLLEGDTKDAREWREKVDTWWSNELGIPEFSPRFAMQYYGTDIMRKYLHQDIWLMTVKNRIRKTPCLPTVITDVRFSNEVDFIKTQGGVFINIQRGEKPAWYDIAYRANCGDESSLNLMKSKYSDIHPSEWSWIGLTGDIVLSNNSTIEALDLELHRIMLKIRSNRV